ncbi:MAG TPA: hypothetical protein PLQ57_07425 [Saprospiraceae bacterium]|nr:hypothetical protein [Saprospiraceae bacterium]HRG20844.1 hypothetical protein [Saprospiraceae bacterium]HRG64229.1 hypothetical protein [Saprospiraceae bacterium]
MNNLLGKHSFFTLLPQVDNSSARVDGVKMPTISTGNFCVTLSED